MKQLYIFFTAIILCAALSLAAQTREHIVKSALNNKRYQLHVLLPKTYSTADSLHYPVLYILDGKYSFPLFQSILNLFGLGRAIKDVIIVTIEGVNKTGEDWLANRYYDYTPSSIPPSDTIWSKILHVPVEKMISGGAKIFLNVLQKELIPYIAKNYKTTPDRGLSGHSLGGLFTSYCLFTNPALFTRYGIKSPSLWWNNNEMLLTENSFAQKDSAISAKVFLSIGALEGDMMVNPFNTFLQALKNHHYPGLQLTTQIFENETHLSVVPACSSRELSVLYGITAK